MRQGEQGKSVDDFTANQSPSLKDLLPTIRAASIGTTSDALQVGSVMKEGSLE